METNINWKSLFHFDLDKSEKKNLFVITAIGFILRLIYVLETQSSPFIQHPFSDSEIYANWALDLIDFGGWFGAETFFMSPAYPYILGIVFLIFGKNFIVIRLIQVIVSTLNIILIYFIGRNLHSKNAGYLSAVIASVYSIFIFYSGAILSETFQVFIISFLILVLTNDWKKFNYSAWFAVGITTGLAAVFRANILIFPLLILLWFAWKYIKSKTEFAKKGIVGISAGIVLIIAPVTLNNYLASGDFVPLTSNGGINFYIGNNENAVGVFVTPQQFDYYNDMSGKKYAEQQMGIELSPSEASNYWYEKSVDYLTSNPVDATKLFLKKLILFWGEGENAQSSIMDDKYFAENYSSILQLPLVNFILISIFSLIGITLNWNRKPNHSLIILLLFAYIFATVLFFVNGRFRLGITPLLIVFASIGIINLYNIFRESTFDRIKIPVIIVLAFMVSYYFIIDKPKFTDYDAYLKLGDIAYNEGEYKKAVENYKRSLFYNENYQAYMNLGNSYAMLKDYRQAVAAFNLAINRNDNYALTHFNLGFAYTQMGNLELASKEYQKAIDIDPQFADAYRNMGIVMYISERYEEAIYYYEKFLQFAMDEEIKSSVRQDISTLKKLIEGADIRNN
ncbi:MAG: tetratricopeptide repeat protein [Melioribacteraceae bacterium]|nr:tetratricopeptide repeat protein [Melioribacteraceae bacterium]MCF8393853.1 tetratricopeptide repeat protein [Melioribacteraceae bacterium]MCF8418226.1 tetratricopeptide repeat protein [Melioribacteraceae bacterium]